MQKIVFLDIDGVQCRRCIGKWRKCYRYGYSGLPAGRNYVCRRCHGRNFKRYMKKETPCT